LFATDTAFIKNNFKSLGINHLLIEANYSEEIVNRYLEQGTIDKSRVDRVLKTHMEIQTTKEFVKANMTSNLDSVLLLHLSDGNSNAGEFHRSIQEVVGEKVKVYVADRNLSYQLDICPF
jgi:hypothetical protein